MTAERLHAWPFDGWEIPAGKLALVEVRPAMWPGLVPVAALSAGQKDAFVTASWLRAADNSGELNKMLQPALSQPTAAQPVRVAASRSAPAAHSSAAPARNTGAVPD